MERLYRDHNSLHPDFNTYYHVVISKPGPRGGKRPPLMDARTRASSYDEAVEYVEREFLRRTKTEVSAG